LRQDLAKGKLLAEAQCNSCHPLARAASGYTAEGWDTVLRMMANFGVHIPPADLALIREYLVTTYPERAKPAGAVLPGPFKVSMTQWPRQRQDRECTIRSPHATACSGTPARW